MSREMAPVEQHQVKAQTRGFQKISEGSLLAWACLDSREPQVSICLVLLSFCPSALGLIIASQRSVKKIRSGSTVRAMTQGGAQLFGDSSLWSVLESRVGISSSTGQPRAQTPRLCPPVCCF